MKKLTVIAILVVAVLALLNIVYQPGIEPDVVYEMANRNIVWQK